MDMVRRCGWPGLAALLLVVGWCGAEEGLHLGDFAPSGTDLGEVEQYEVAMGERVGEVFWPKGFVFVAGRYLEAPYRVDRRGTRVYINGYLTESFYRRIPGEIQFPKPEPPANLGTMTQLDETRFYRYAMWAYLERAVPLEERNLAYVAFLRSLPMVRDVRIGDDKLDLVITLADGSEELLWQSLSWNEKATSDELVAEANRAREHWEARLKEERGTLFLDPWPRSGNQQRMCTWWTENETRDKLPELPRALEERAGGNGSDQPALPMGLRAVAPSPELKARVAELLATPPPPLPPPPLTYEDYRRRWQAWAYPRLVEIADKQGVPETQGLRLMLVAEDRALLRYEPVRLYFALISSSGVPADLAPLPTDSGTASNPPEQPLRIVLTRPDGEVVAGRPWPVPNRQTSYFRWYAIGDQYYWTCSMVASAFVRDRQPWFTVSGRYKLQLMYHAKPDLTLKSNVVEVEVREAETEGERQALEILDSPLVRQAYFDGQYIEQKQSSVPVVRKLVELIMLDLPTYHHGQVFHVFHVSGAISNYRMVAGFGIPEETRDRWGQLNYDARYQDRWLMTVLGLDPPAELREGAFPRPAYVPFEEKLIKGTYTDPWNLEKNGYIPAE